MHSIPRLRCGIVLWAEEDTCQVLAEGQVVRVRYASQFPAPRSERVSPGHLVAIAELPGDSAAVVWRWYDAVVLGGDTRSARLWEPGHGQVIAQRRRPGQPYPPGTRAYLSAGLPGADWWVAGSAVNRAENADVELNEVERLYTDHDMWDSVGEPSKLHAEGSPAHGLQPIGDNGTMAADYDRTGPFRGASFTGADFTGAKFRDCDLRQVKVTDSWLVDVSVSGLVGNFVVNDVDVTAFVEGELDRRHPERVQLRAVRTADDYRAMWQTIERLWSDTVARAGRLPGPALGLRVDDEWSFVETLRHLVFATDAWAGRAILGEPLPYHRLGLPHADYPHADAAALGIDLDARTSLAEVKEVRANRMALVRGIIDGLTDARLERVCERPPSPRHPEEIRSVGRCLRVIMKEECEHRRYAVRDLAALEADLDAG